jgi:hypothetical protein
MYTSLFFSKNEPIVKNKTIGENNAIFDIQK